MAKTIIIDPSHGGVDAGLSNDNISEKELSLLISNYIYNRLNKLGIPAKLTRNTDITLSDDDRINIIKNISPFNKDTVVLSNEIINTNNGTEIIYALRNTDRLAETINNQFENSDLTVNKFYQQRLPSNTSLDYDYLIRKSNPTEAIIVKYDILNDYENYKEYAEAVIRAITIYLNKAYLPPSGSNYYTVQKGDSLYSIANKFNTSVSEIKSLNNLSSNLLSIGQILKIPSINQTNNTYTVQKGDSLYSIANKFNTSVSEIKSLNNLSSNLLSIGQILKISSINQTNNTYTVQKGDSLYNIANKFNTSVSEIKALNNLSSNLLSIGQILKIK